MFSCCVCVCFEVHGDHHRKANHGLRFCFFFLSKELFKKWYFWIKFITIIVSLLFSNWKAQLDLACLWKESCQKKKIKIYFGKKTCKIKQWKKKVLTDTREIFKILKMTKFDNVFPSKFLRSRFAKLWGIWLSKNQTKNHQGIV